MENKGFTIVELIITIFVLSIAVIGVYNAFSILLIATTSTINRLTAAYLAQEGVEIVRNIRDTNWIKSDANPEITWLTGLGGCEAETAESGCEADYKTDVTAFSQLELFGSEGGRYLAIDENGFYSYDISDNNTRFRRKIIITPLNEHVAKVEVGVYWDEKPNILNTDKSSFTLVLISYVINPFIKSSSRNGLLKVTEYLYNWY